MTTLTTDVLLRFHDTPGIETLDVYCKYGGYQALAESSEDAA